MSTNIGLSLEIIIIGFQIATKNIKSKKKDGDKKKQNKCKPKSKQEQMKNNNGKKGRPKANKTKKTNMQIHAVVFLRIRFFSAVLLVFWCPFFENVCFSLLFDFSSVVNFAV